jgi:putative transposase
VNQDLLLRNENLIAENRILRGHLTMRLRLADPERVTLAEIATRLGRKALKDVAQLAKPDTILAWYRRLIAQKFEDPGIVVIPGVRGLLGNRGVSNPDRARKPDLGL